MGRAIKGLVVKNNRLEKIMRELGATQKYVAVGVLGSKGQEQHKGDKLGTTVAEVATWNHFGTSTIPARPFLTIALARQRGEIDKLRGRIAQGVISGKLTIDRGLGLLGAFLVGAVKQEIAAGMPPENAPSTVAAKGSSTPLINTGQLRGSITFEIRNAADE
jgi:phage gpG-like protein